MSVDRRTAVLRRFAVTVTIFVTAGHLFLGFEQSALLPFVALLTGYSVEILLELIRSRTSGVKSRIRLNVMGMIDFLLSAHITSLVISMLLYPNEHVFPIVFAVTVAISSKYIFRITIQGVSRHFMNPSNTGIALTLILFPWVGIAPPYHFTENISGFGDWLLPAAIFISGSFINAVYTKRIPLIVAWVGVFALQAVVRSFVFDTPLLAPLGPMTGVAFMLFTFYMVEDPGTTPLPARQQVVFGASVAIAYSILMMSHIVFGLFFALVAVCVLRGCLLYGLSLKARLAPRSASATTYRGISPEGPGQQLAGIEGSEQ